MKIHQITQLFAPDSLGGAVLFTDFARFMRERGHDVRVTSTFPYYPRLKYAPGDEGVAVREEIFEGIPLRRVGMKLPAKHRGWRRLIPELTYWRALRRHGRFEGWRPDVVFGASPMLAQPLAARGLYGEAVPSVVVVQDLMADAARRLGIIRQPGLGRLLAALERRTLRRVDRLVTISEEMGARLGELTGGPREISVVRNWIHASLEREAAAVSTEGIVRTERSLIYSGNVGVKQGLPDFLMQFFGLKTGWSLRVHGDGAEAEALRRTQAAQPELTIGPLLPEPAYVRALAEAQACLITQRAGVGDSFLPSKLLPALATGTPVLAVCERASPLGREVSAHGFGEIVDPGDGAGVQRVLQRWADEPGALVRLSERARVRAGAFDRVSALNAYEMVLAEAAGKAEGRR